MTETSVRALMALAGFSVLRLRRMPNWYLGDLEPLTDDQISKDAPGEAGCVDTSPDRSAGVFRAWMNDYRWRYERPAWMVKTQFGFIEIGWRKRVIQIDWSETGISGDVTSDDVTKHLQLVHAWSEEKALEYLKAIRALGEARAA